MVVRNKLNIKYIDNRKNYVNDGKTKERYSNYMNSNNCIVIILVLLSFISGIQVSD